MTAADLGARLTNVPSGKRATIRAGGSGSVRCSCARSRHVGNAGTWAPTATTSPRHAWAVTFGAAHFKRFAGHATRPRVPASATTLLLAMTKGEGGANPVPKSCHIAGPGRANGARFADLLGRLIFDE